MKVVKYDPGWLENKEFNISKEVGRLINKKDDIKTETN